MTGCHLDLLARAIQGIRHKTNQRIVGLPILSDFMYGYLYRIAMHAAYLRFSRTRLGVHIDIDTPLSDCNGIINVTHG